MVELVPSCLIIQQIQNDKSWVLCCNKFCSLHHNVMNIKDVVTLGLFCFYRIWSAKNNCLFVTMLCGRLAQLSVQWFCHWCCVIITALATCDNLSLKNFLLGSKAKTVLYFSYSTMECEQCCMKTIIGWKLQSHGMGRILNCFYKGGNS